MMEDPCIIQMNIDRYRAMLGPLLSGEQHARIEQLLAEAVRQLARAAAPGHLGYGLDDVRQ